jgi:transcriptional regulator with XRE-family HTH domain
MAKYHNRIVTKLIGESIKKIRNKQNLEIEDIAEITGFHRNTINSIEQGANTDLSHFVEIAFALNKQPKEILEIDFEIKPRNSLSKTRKEKNRLTVRILMLIEEGFFKKEKTTREVCDALTGKYPESTHIATKNISVILMRQAQQKKLRIIKHGRKNSYQTIRKK